MGREHAQTWKCHRCGSIVSQHTHGCLIPCLLQYRLYRQHPLSHIQYRADIRYHDRERDDYPSGLHGISQTHHANGDVPDDYITGMFSRAGIHYTFGIRGFYYTVPLIAWFLGAWLFITLTLLVLFLTLRLDYGKSRFPLSWVC